MKGNTYGNPRNNFSREKKRRKPPQYTAFKRCTAFRPLIHLNAIGDSPKIVGLRSIFGVVNREVHRKGTCKVVCCSALSYESLKFINQMNPIEPRMADVIKKYRRETV